MEWKTKELPDDGFYWAKDPCGENDIFYVYRDGEAVYYRSLWSGYGPLNELEDLLAYKWYGPIEVPEEE